MSVLGNRVRRKEDPRFLRGEGRYVENVPLAIGLALALLALDVTAWRVVSRLFDRERLITGHHRTDASVRD